MPSRKIPIGLCLAALTFAQTPAPRPKPRASEPPPRIVIEEVIPTGNLLLVSDLEVQVLLDGAPLAMLKADTPVTVKVRTGAHIVTAREESGSALFQQAIQVRETHGSAVHVTKPEPDAAVELEYLPAAVNILPAGVQFAKIAAGTAVIGCAEGDSACHADETPRFTLTVGLPFFLMDTEVTVGQYQEYAGRTRQKAPTLPRWSQANHPMVNVTWLEADSFCRFLGGRLPNEAEWEFAVRSGRRQAMTAIDHDHANFGTAKCCDGATEGRDQFLNTAPVKSFAPDGAKLYDMAGNVWEWVASTYQEYPLDLTGSIAEGPLRSVRGGGWNSAARELRVSNRNSLEPGHRYEDTGFRCLVGTRVR